MPTLPSAHCGFILEGTVENSQQMGPSVPGLSFFGIFLKAAIHVEFMPFCDFFGHGTSIFLGSGYIYIMEKVHFMGTFSKDNNKAAFLGTTSLYLFCLDEFTLGLSLKICSFYNYCQ